LQPIETELFAGYIRSGSFYLSLFSLFFALGNGAKCVQLRLQKYNP
jgi:hypothetical protein